MKKGDITKGQILDAAKKEFYEKGYIQTKMNQITRILKIQPSWITYYFKSKDNLTREIFRELFEKIDETIQDSPIVITELLQFHFVRIRLLYRILLRDECTTRFFYEINQKKATVIATKPLVDEMYREIVREYQLTVTDEEFRMVRGIDTAGRMDFFEKYLRGEYDLLLDDAVTILEGVVPRLLGIKQKKVDSLLLSSIRVANAISVEKIPFLKEETKN